MAKLGNAASAALMPVGDEATLLLTRVPCVEGTERVPLAEAEGWVLAQALAARLVKGARRGPPKGIDGPWGYAEFLQAIADPKHERHAELNEWSGEDFDPECLSTALAQLAKPKRTRSKKTPPPSQN